MKKLITILLLCLTMLSCTTRWDLDKQEINLTQGTVLAKKTWSNRGFTHYEIYAFDGREATWLESDYETYNRAKEGQKMEVMVIRRTYFDK